MSEILFLVGKLPKAATLRGHWVSRFLPRRIRCQIVLEPSTPSAPISGAAALMGNRDYSDGCALNSENQCVGKTLEI